MKFEARHYEILRNLHLGLPWNDHYPRGTPDGPPTFSRTYQWLDANGYIQHGAITPMGQDVLAKRYGGDETPERRAAVDKAIAIIQRFISIRENTVANGHETLRYAAQMIEMYGRGVEAMLRSDFCKGACDEVRDTRERMILKLFPQWRQVDEQRYLGPRDLI